MYLPPQVSRAPVPTESADASEVSEAENDAYLSAHARLSAGSRFSLPVFFLLVNLEEDKGGICSGQ